MLPLDVLSLAFLTISAVADFTRVSAALVNVTIDDTFGDPTTGNQIVYDPPGVWKVGQNCSDCTAQPDRSQLVNGTWHDGTFSAIDENGNVSNQLLTAAVTFQGVAVYVYCVVTHSFRSPVGNSDMSFFIDGILVGNFVQPPTGDTTYQYNVPVYVNESLPFGSHTIAIVNGHPSGNQSLTLLDRIVYTYVFPALSPVFVPTDPASVQTRYYFLRELNFISHALPYCPRRQHYLLSSQCHGRDYIHFFSHAHHRHCYSCLYWRSPLPGRCDCPHNLLRQTTAAHLPVTQRWSHCTRRCAY
ncbi:hypothetical protein L227DRAFT_505389 [Lentinus tigrinus ALCF2SS1-6]|uniref:Uncharacterized protein n=1 Tax=Lentinus tigrinus ALCF2SS1-6 TaxID=1328759 RepID=A0A5C2S4D2_9APHY|nr:hypothetical protein L227DRAFT_505389 [Lentinus tigrinus ALCF2SS1-6]